MTAKKINLNLHLGFTTNFTFYCNSVVLPFPKKHKTKSNKINFKKNYAIIAKYWILMKRLVTNTRN